VKVLPAITAYLYVGVPDETTFVEALRKYTMDREVSVSWFPGKFTHGFVDEPVVQVVLLLDYKPANAAAQEAELMSEAIALASTLRQACHQQRVLVQLFVEGTAVEVTGETINRD